MKMTQQQIQERLEYLRGELRGERISYGELHELQSLARHIDPGDTELLEAVNEDASKPLDLNGRNINDPDYSVEDDDEPGAHPHECQWGPLERSRLAGTVHRKCQVPGCRAINALDDDEPEE